ncbi:phytoene desaturase family protein [Novosphingobium rosa]|uniref:phytoene desaturase family protein n=1 Tax=Novosphingobium rosa TaxID=76978 RepID=UPI00082EC7B7|nr:NAD(P)/FAD-dependent oxidoreductase [Novosphingobium rosa]
MSAPPRHDVVLIGSGINALVCAALLARRGRKVCVLERNSVAGGCIRTEELTLPGFRHDTLSTLYPLFVSAPHFAELGPALAEKGVRFVNSETPTATVLPDGRAVLLRRDRQANIAAFEALGPGEGAAFQRAMADIESSAALTFGMLGNALWGRKSLRILLGEGLRRGPRGLTRTIGQAMGSCRDWLEGKVKSDLLRALCAPWILHVGLSPEAPLSGHMAKLILLTLEQFGSPMVEGGSDRIVAGFRAIIEEHGGEIRTDAPVSDILIEKGRASGVRLASGEVIRARRAVVANVTPTQLYGGLLPDLPALSQARQDGAAYRYGRGEMQIHLALDAPPAWHDPALGKVAMLHLTPGLDAVSQAVNEAERGLLPAQPTIVVAQPTALDPSRAPQGKAILWIQLQELPRDGQLRGDAAGRIAVPADGRWTPQIRDAYAERIIDGLCQHIAGLRESIIGRHVIGPGDLPGLNINLVDGDPYAGSCALDQFLLWRPAGAMGGHNTPVKRLWHIGASTHPGPGLGGMSGYLASRAIG